MGSGVGPPPASRGQEHPRVSREPAKRYYPARAFPQNPFFGADSRHQPGVGARGNAAKHVCAVAETGRWPGCGGEPGTAGASLPGEPAGWRGARAGDRNAVCRGSAGSGR